MTTRPLVDTDVHELVAYLNNSSFWTITRPGRWIAASGEVIETQYVRGEGTVTLYKKGGRETDWRIRGREVNQRVRELIN